MQAASKSQNGPRRWGPIILLLCVILGVAGCASHSPTRPYTKTREFDPRRDGFAYTNELVWDYSFDEAGRMSVSRREPPPTYAHHCFAVSRAARQFFAHAEFRPELPPGPEHDLEWVVRKVLGRSTRSFSGPGERLVIPGYTNLWHLSEEQPDLLKAKSDKAWMAYVQRGNWRMIFPFSRGHQERTARKLEELLETREPLIVHLVRFPQLTINHAVAVYHARSNPETVEFDVYDPNVPGQTSRLIYDRARRTFTWPRSNYFKGGRVDVYRIYHGLCY